MDSITTSLPEQQVSKDDTILNLPVILVIFAGLTGIMFGDLLFTSHPFILSRWGTDLVSQFIYWRDFGFRELLHGHLALWNPHIFSGEPFFAGIQSALLYPPNFIYLILPLELAINWSIALHVFLLGFFMYLWTKFRGLNSLAALMTGILAMFSSTYFLHIFAGHLPNSCSMVWIPLILLSIDGFMEKQSWNWVFLGIFSVSMQIFAGHPQYVYYTGITASIYFLLSLYSTKNKLKSILGFIFIYAGAIAISAIQLLAGFEASAESVRSGSVPYAFASLYSFPPENFLTLLNPIIFGNDLGVEYWGRWYIWEMNVFIGITGLFLALYASQYADRKRNKYSILMILILSVFALGVHTPLFKLFYLYLPGFNKFRGSSKFIFPASLFLIYLSGLGMDHLLKEKKISTAFSCIPLILGVILGIFSIALNSNLSHFGTWLVKYIYNTGQTNITSSQINSSIFIQQTSKFTSQHLFYSVYTCFLLFALCYSLRKYTKYVYGIFGLAILEVFLFAQITRPSFDLNWTKMPELQQYFAEHPGDYRVLNRDNPNTSMSLGSNDIWGYDPGVSKRYAEFITFTQGIKPEYASQYITFKQMHPLYAMLRMKYVIDKQNDMLKVQPLGNPLPRFLFIQNYQVITKRDQILEAMDTPTFNPSNQVILEQHPSILPSTSIRQSSLSFRDINSDRTNLDITVSQPVLLVITDGYSKGWKARALPGSVQQKYDILPANYILRAIPLNTGHHLISMEYSPDAYRIGKWISTFSILMYLLLLGLYKRKQL